MIRKALACIALSVASVALPAHAQTPTSAVINFESFLNPGAYSGAPELDPFIPGTEVNNLINGVFGDTAPTGSEDWKTLLGQIIIPNFSGDGTYTSTDDGVGIYLHSVLLNRIETVSLRTEGALTSASLGLGAGRIDGQPTGKRDDIYLPDFDPNGVVSVTISGDNVSIDYLLDFDTLPESNGAFLRDGITPTNISNRLDAVGSRFRSIGVKGSGVDTPGLFEVGQEDDSIPYGAFYNLDPRLDGTLTNTIADTTLALLRNEIAVDNISSDGNQAGLPNPDFLTDPYAGRNGEFVAVYDLLDQPLATTVALTVPEPGAAVLLLSGAVGAVVRRRRK